MHQKENLTQEELKSQLRYEPTTGAFYRIARPRGSNVPMGLVTTKPTSLGYIRIRVLGKKYMAHRLAYLYVEGVWPDQIDHDDRVRDNNVWANLINSSDLSNRKNISLRKTNNTGIAGISWNSKRNRFVARITDNYKQHWLGQFKTLDEAILARNAANIKFKVHKNNGSSVCKY